ncbi:MAG TPA: cyclic nucleotide-binding domain-containing protein [Alphaproteobacteria bacterium]|nr:cyclic nucleotide-binding domain-containing protein [Alphaproteobacteria bacterium]
MTACLTAIDQRAAFYLPGSPATIERLHNALSIHDFTRGTVLARQGDMPRNVHFLESGYVGTTVTSPQAHDYIIAFFRPGDVFLLCSVMLNTPYPVAITLLQDSRIATVPVELFRACAATDLTLATGVAKALATQRQILAVHIRDLKLQPPAQRLASFLLNLAEDGDSRSALLLPCDRRILAGWLGLVPASASRAFRELERIGITGRGRQIEIASLDRLREFVHAA